MFVGKDLFGAEPFDPFTCGGADFPPDIQSKLDEMQVSHCLSASDAFSLCITVAKIETLLFVIVSFGANEVLRVFIL